jgi:hypothetical protein
MTNRDRRSSDAGRGVTRRHAARAARPMLLAACALLTGCPPDSPAGQPAAPGGAPGQSAGPGMTGGAFALYGKPFSDPAVQAYIQEGRQCYVDRMAQVVCPLLGIEMALDHDDVVRLVRAYVNAIGHFTSYSGPLPYGILVGDSREAVVRKVGEPSDRFSDSDLFKATTPWLGVTYHPETSPNVGRIRHVALYRQR